MPSFAELQKRLLPVAAAKENFHKDEVLITDARAQMTPAQFVEEKFHAALASRLHPHQRSTE